MGERKLKSAESSWYHSTFVIYDGSNLCHIEP